MILVHDSLIVIELFELCHVICNTKESLLAQFAHSRRLFKHINDFILQAFLADVPHELHVLSARHKDVAVISRYDPVMTLARPLVADLSDTEDIAWVIDRLHARACDISLVIEKVELASYDHSSFIFSQEQERSLLYSFESDLTQEPLELIRLESCEKSHFLE